MCALLAVLVIVASVSLVGIASSASDPAVRFANLPVGWHAADLYALSWRSQPSEAGWAAGMPRNGIAVTVIVLPKRVGYPPLRLTLPKRPAGTLEGVANTREYRIFGRTRGRDVEIRVAIRRLSPTPGQLRQAQRVVSGIRFIPAS